jgi:fructose-1,6-bisphosphatase/sedoheptulose 1,7-bisphosphatase-like protein
MKLLSNALAATTLLTAKLSILTLAVSFPLLAAAEPEPQLSANAPLVYVNKNIGFNVKGYKYKQSEFPCEIDSVLVSNLIARAQTEGIRLEAIATRDKILNGVVPVLAIDIEQLVLGGESRQFGTKRDSNLPKVQITAALVKNKNNIVTAKHTCAIMTLNQFTPSSNIMDMGSNGVTVCSATRKCLQDLSKDVVEWIAPQVK